MEYVCPLCFPTWLANKTPHLTVCFVAKQFPEETAGSSALHDHNDST